MDGFEVLKIIKGTPGLADIPVIITSNFGQQKDIEWGKKLGAKQFIEKVNMVPADLVDLVRQETGVK
jgi:CheY-like chemotaxis protein